jgi:sugar phosphate isomerase/epimerase
MKLGLMQGTPANEMREMGFDAVQLHFGVNQKDDAADLTDDEIKASLNPGNIALAGLTVHIGLVDSRGLVQIEIDRMLRLVDRAAAVKNLVGDNPRPILVWHPNSYPEAADTDDAAVFKGLVSALRTICNAAEKKGVDIAVELTYRGVDRGVEGFLRLQDHVASPALRVCLDAANVIIPYRTPLVHTVRLLADDIVIAHGKDRHFKADGSVATFGPTGSGNLDYATYIACLKDYCNIPYFILEYYKTREEILRARDIVLQYL